MSDLAKANRGSRVLSESMGNGTLKTKIVQNGGVWHCALNRIRHGEPNFELERRDNRAFRDTVCCSARFIGSGSCPYAAYNDWVRQVCDAYYKALHSASDAPQIPVADKRSHGEKPSASWALLAVAVAGALLGYALSQLVPA